MTEGEGFTVRGVVGVVGVVGVEGIVGGNGPKGVRGVCNECAVIGCAIVGTGVVCIRCCRGGWAAASIRSGDFSGGYMRDVAVGVVGAVAAGAWCMGGGRGEVGVAGLSSGAGPGRCRTGRLRNAERAASVVGDESELVGEDARASG